ncbi:MAG TPA: EAL domain-containing protein [Thermoanaerobaculia bacterium]|nr:EAL domain-containing protein [Thermoanaerobaculia bacterium]
MDESVRQSALDRALDDTASLVLLYQPIHDARTGAIYGAEALLRQRRESGELRSAHVISQAAERSPGPELFALDNMLVKKAYTDAAAWQSRFDVRLNVNLSPREFQEGDVLGRLRELVTSCGVDTTHVNLEITETSYIKKPKETMKVLDDLRELGISLWLDDFGTGHSSLTHLQHFPISGVKVPGSFVKELPDDKRCRAITAGIIRMAHDVGIEVIAEEIETEAQLECLREMECDYIQGFLFSKPMECGDFLKKLENSR